MKSRKGLIIVAVLCLSLGLYFVVQIARYINKQSEIDANYYASEACMPQFAYLSDRSGIINYIGSSYNAFETKKYSSVEKLCAALPAGCEQAVKDALNNGSGKNAKDIRDNFVIRYEVSKEDLPFVKKDRKSDVDFHYCVLEYPNDTYRFALIIEIMYTR